MTIKQILFNDIDWKYILKLFLVLRIITLIAAIIGLNFLPLKISFPYINTELEKYGHSLFWSWANFDGVHYLLLSKQGYNFALTQAYFPFYFILIRFVNLIINNNLLSGLFLSHLFFILSLGMLYKLIKMDYSEKIAKNTLLLLTLFPTSFFFLSVYTESLFLFLTLTFFYLLHKKRFIWAGIFGAIASATKITGIFLIPAFIYFIYENNKYISIKKQSILIQVKYIIKKYWVCFLPTLGLISYMFYLWQKFNDPLMFIHSQAGFGAGRTTTKFILIYQVFWRYLKMIITVDKTNPIYFTTWLELITTILFISLIIYGYIKKIKKEYLIYSLLALILPTLTGILSSMPRYVLVLFPGFIILSTIFESYKKNSKIIYKVYLILSILLLIICTALFTRGYWIS